MLKRSIALAIASALTAFGAQAQAPAAKTIKMQSTWPASNTLQEHFKIFAERVDKLSQGSLKIEAIPVIAAKIDLYLMHPRTMRPRTSMPKGLQPLHRSNRSAIDVRLGRDHISTMALAAAALPAAAGPGCFCKWRLEP